MGAVALRAVAALALAAGFPASAHEAQALGSAGSLWRWSGEVWLLWLLAVSLLLYLAGLARLWQHAGPGRGIRRSHAAGFALGWLALTAALVSPLDALGAQLFCAHMVQHELLMIVAAPLLVLGRPLALWTWGLAPAHRRWIARATHRRWLEWLWTGITQPLAAWALHALALWIWHVPRLFDAALRSEGLHVLQHASFLATALLFWWAVLGAGQRAQGSGMAMVSLFTTMMHTGALGALLTLAATPWYPGYVHAGAVLGLDPLQDQQLGGLVMWVPGGLAYLLAGLAVTARVLARHPAAATAAHPGPLR